MHYAHMYDGCIISFLKVALWRCMGVNYNNKKQAKMRYSTITGQHEKNHTQVFKNQSND